MIVYINNNILVRTIEEKTNKERKSFQRFLKSPLFDYIKNL